MAITMKDVAKHAGLSLGTVSNCINGKESVSDVNRKKIDRAISELGYQVNWAARSLKTNSHKTIGVLIPTFSNVYLVKIVRSIEKYLRMADYDMLVQSYDGGKEEQIMFDLASKVDGMIFAPAHYNYSLETLERVHKNTPIVTVNEKLEYFSCDSVGIDNYDVAYRAIDWLVKHGHKNICMIAGAEGLYTTKQRIDGYRSAHFANGIEPFEAGAMMSDFSSEKGYSMCIDIIENFPEVTAIFSSGYRITLGVITALNERNMRDKIEIVGFDSEDLSAALPKSLFYVDQPYRQTAELATKLVLERVRDGKNNPPTTIKLEASLKNFPE